MSGCMWDRMYRILRQVFSPSGDKRYAGTFLVPLKMVEGILEGTWIPAEK